jgi:hypothetical protein
MKTHSTRHRALLLIGFLLFLSTCPIQSQFTAGEGGSLPTFPIFTEIPNKVPGFLIESSDRNNNSFGGGTYPVITMKFPEPSTFGASTYTLQYSENGTNWSNYQHNDEDLTTNYNNFSFNPGGNYYFRLLLNGGPKDGFTSNEEFAALANLKNMFTSWYMDEGMFLTGIMAPNIGRGIETSFTVTDLTSTESVEGSLTYQWYRINPLTYEMTLIDGATSLTYTTTIADAGYELCIIATGDGIKVDGFKKIISSWGNVIPNKSFASQVNNNGFTLNLFKTTNGLELEDLKLRDNEYNEVQITSINAGNNSAIYEITAALDISKAPYHLNCDNKFWSIVEEFEQSFTMTGVTIDFTTNIDAFYQHKTKLLVKGSYLYFESDVVVNHLNIIDLTGKIRQTYKLEIREGKIDISSLKQGIYIVRVLSEKEETITKIAVVK